MSRRLIGRDTCVAPAGVRDARVAPGGVRGARIILRSACRGPERLIARATDHGSCHDPREWSALERSHGALSVAQMRRERLGAFPLRSNQFAHFDATHAPAVLQLPL
jgi:hypothetical protein